MMKLAMILLWFFVFGLPATGVPAEKMQGQSETAPLSEEDREIIKILEVLKKMDLMKDLDMLKDLEILDEENANEDEE